MDFIMYPELTASDINRAAAWYRDKLGLEPVMHGGERIGPGAMPEVFDSQLLYENGTATFGVYESNHAGKNHATAARLVTPDFDAPSPSSPNAVSCSRTTTSARSSAPSTAS